MNQPSQAHPLGTMSRRQMLKLMGTAAGASVLAACVAPAPGGAPASSSGGAAAPAAAPKKLVVAHRKEYFEEMEKLFVDAVQGWGKENNYEIETNLVASEAFEDFVAKILAQIQAGDPPSLVYHIRLVQALYGQDGLDPVTDAAEEAIKLYGDVPFGHRVVEKIGDDWWGIPYMSSGGGQFARKDVFAAAGVDIAATTTFDERREAALKASNPEAQVYGWGITVNKSGDGRGFIEAVIQNWGGHYTDEGLTQVTFNSPETLAAVEWLAETYLSEKFQPMLPPGVTSWTDSSNNEAYLAGSIALTSNAASIYAKAKADKNPVFENTLHLQTAVGPLGQKQQAGGGGYFAIPKGAPNQDGAKQLGLHLLKPEIFLPISLISAGLFLPAYANHYTNPEVVKAFEADPNLKSMGEASLGDFPGSSWPALPNAFFDAIQAEAIIEDMMAQIITNGAKPAEAVATAHDRIQKIADEMGALTK
ncbi:MAG: extracellular solute-binding protein [Caldilineaceae bacterium]